MLKLVFAIPLKDMEVETIKKHLKDDELKGIIKIQEDLSEILAAKSTINNQCFYCVLIVFFL